MTIRKKQRQLTSRLMIAGLLTTGMAISVNTQAQDTSLMVDVGPCISLESAVQRFACYEAQADAALNGGEAFTSPVQVTAPPAPAQQPAATRQTQATAPAVTSSPSASSTSQADPNADFGLPQPRSERNSNNDELFATVAAVSQNLPNRYTITLDNGQVWRQTEAKKNFRLEEGDEIRIYSSRWSSSKFRLEAIDSKGFIRVERAQ